MTDLLRVAFEDLVEADARGEIVELLIPGQGGTLLAVRVREDGEVSEGGDASTNEMGRMPDPLHFERELE